MVRKKKLMVVLTVIILLLLGGYLLTILIFNIPVKEEIRKTSFNSSDLSQKNKETFERSVV